LWIHGGALSVGMGSFPGFESLAAHQDVVVVSFNYRLGVLGFLSTGDENMPGNYGFLDQVSGLFCEKSIDCDIVIKLKTILQVYGETSIT